MLVLKCVCVMFDREGESESNERHTHAIDFAFRLNSKWILN